MEQQGVSQEELADRLGCTVENVNQLMTKKGGLHLATVDKLAAALGCRVVFRLPPTNAELAAAPEATHVAPPRLHSEELEKSSIRVRRLLYDYIAACYFREGPPEAADDRRCWRHSPDDCRLRVSFLDGCWFARWTVPGSEEELVRFDLDRGGRLVHYKVETCGK